MTMRLCCGVVLSWRGCVSYKHVACVCLCEHFRTFRIPSKSSRALSGVNTAPPHISRSAAYARERCASWKRPSGRSFQ